MSNETDKVNTQICSIKIMFPVISDDQAIEYKKKIALVLVEIPESQTQFTLVDMPLKQ